MVLEAFSRIQIRPTALTSHHMWDARMSASLLLTSEWATKPSIPNLWKIQLFSIPLVQGLAQYPVPRNVVAILDYYVRQAAFGTPVSFPPSFSTSAQGISILTESGLPILTESGQPLLTEGSGASSNIVTVNWPGNGLQVGQFISITVPVSVGGIILSGLYPVVSVLSPSSFTIAAATTATSAVTNGGVVPLFTTQAGSGVITVVFPAHGLSVNENFSIQAQTAVGGLNIFGIFPVASVIDANTFTFVFQGIAGFSQSAYENGGLVQIAAQLNPNNPTDRVVTPFSRTDYSAVPNKAAQAFPSNVWWDRQINSVLNFWPTPDQNGPYILYYYAMVQIQDVTLTAGTTLDLPVRFLSAFCAGLAAALAEKYPPPPPNTIERLEAKAMMLWGAVSGQDVEDVPMYLSPGLTGYFRN